jgi:hypothetical protein
MTELIDDRSIRPEEIIKELFDDDVHYEVEADIICKDEDKKQVFGWASIASIDGKPITDTQGDLITSDTLEAAAYDYVLEARKAGEMHKAAGDDVKKVGSMIESCVFTREKQKAMQSSLTEQDIHAVIDCGCVAWWIGFVITDDSVWKDIKDGKLRAFSIGGKGKRSRMDESWSQTPGRRFADGLGSGHASNPF